MIYFYIYHLNEKSFWFMHSKPLSWQMAWEYPAFRSKFILGIVILLNILLFIPHFFQHIETREGHVLNDIILHNLPVIDVSLPIFLILYGMIILFLIKMSNNMAICLTALWALIILCIIRMASITLVPLNPPFGLIEMTDPCSILFYRSNVITKDLFFSGHTATLIIGGLCMNNKRDKIISFASAFIVGILLLIQHVHYSIDVFMAPFFCWVCWYLAKSITKI